MKTSLKAALLSALVYPGAGHFMLKKYVISIILACAFSLPLFFILNDIINISNTVIEQIELGKIPLDVIEIRHQLMNRLESNEGGVSHTMLFILAVVWFIGIVDAYRTATLFGK